MATENPFQNITNNSNKKISKENQSYLSLSRELSELLTRLRLLEERYSNLRRENQITSQNMIENHQNLSRAERKFGESIMKMKRDISEIKEQIQLMKTELSNSANLHQLRTLERYIDLWQPVEFITRSEAIKLIEETKENHSQNKNNKKNNN